MVVTSPVPPQGDVESSEKGAPQTLTTSPQPSPIVGPWRSNEVVERWDSTSYAARSVDGLDLCGHVVEVDDGDRVLAITLARLRRGARVDDERRAEPLSHGFVGVSEDEDVNAELIGLTPAPIHRTHVRVVWFPRAAMDHSYPATSNDVIDLGGELAKPAKVDVVGRHQPARPNAVRAEQDRVVVADDGPRLPLAQEPNGLPAEPGLKVDVPGTPHRTNAFAKLRERPAQPGMTAMHVGHDPDQQPRPIRSLPVRK